MSLLAAAPPLLLAAIVAARLLLEGHGPRSYAVVATLATGAAAAGAILHIGLSGRWEDAWILPAIVLATGALAIGPMIHDDLRDGMPVASYDTLTTAMLTLGTSALVASITEMLARQHGA